jgi:molybdopterin-guanine dinucleotide biosynthesis protein A
MKSLLSHFNGIILKKENEPEDNFLNVNQPEDWVVIQSKINQ